MVHINCKSEKELRKLCDRFFHNTFIFTMNDEIISTGFSKMATYIFSVSTGKKIKVFKINSKNLCYLLEIFSNINIIILSMKFFLK